MLNDLLWFMKERPSLLKRALITDKRIIAWSTVSQDMVMSCWRLVSNQPLRLIPLLPLEGGATQERWNRVWDSSEAITKKIRKTPRS